MASQTVKVGSTVGLHARPASIIAEVASEFDEDVLLTVVDEAGNPVDPDEEPTDASSSLMIMALGAEHGDSILVESENADAVAAVAAEIAKNHDA